MPRPLAGFFIAGESDICLHLPHDMADGRRFKLLANVSVLVDGAQYLALRSNDVSPSRKKFLQVLGYPDKPARAKKQKRSNITHASIMRGR